MPGYWGGQGPGLRSWKAKLSGGLKKSGPLEEQPVLLPSEPSVQPLEFFLMKLSESVRLLKSVILASLYWISYARVMSTQETTKSLSSLCKRKEQIARSSLYFHSLPTKWLDQVLH